ncbi:unnamed protein product [Protopolystoma xenopodis]|uniref:Uncharacterized protein n=1 Tax=Protopolystoma xenopodis TaxID=117903 RepID=A0A3S5FBT7_9PLAT|nr:unnamed protein product [Protopolystoma xenopodis]
MDYRGDSQPHQHSMIRGYPSAGPSREQTALPSQRRAYDGEHLQPGSTSSSIRGAAGCGVATAGGSSSGESSFRSRLGGFVGPDIDANLTPSLSESSVSDSERAFRAAWRSTSPSAEGLEPKIHGRDPRLLVCKKTEDSGQGCNSKEAKLPLESSPKLDGVTARLVSPMLSGLTLKPPIISIQTNTPPSGSSESSSSQGNTPVQKQATGQLGEELMEACRHPEQPVAAMLYPSDGQANEREADSPTPSTVSSNLASSPSKGIAPLQPLHSTMQSFHRQDESVISPISKCVNQPLASAKTTICDTNRRAGLIGLDSQGIKAKGNQRNDDRNAHAFRLISNWQSRNEEVEEHTEEEEQIEVEVDDYESIVESRLCGNTEDPAMLGT